MDAWAEDDFRDFVQSRWLPLVRTASLLTGDQASGEDLAQQALVIAHRRWPSIVRQDAPYAYVRAVMVNLQWSWWRRRRVDETLWGEPAFDVGEPDRTGSVADRDALWRAVLTLPPRMRAVLVLRYYEELSEAETAETLGCSVGSVKSQTSRALDRLRTVLVADDAEERVP